MLKKEGAAEAAEASVLDDVDARKRVAETALRAVTTDFSILSTHLSVLSLASC